MSLRESLTASCPKPQKYAESLGAMPPDISGLRAEVSRLTIYPIKGLGALKLDRARVGEYGLASGDGLVSDRMAMLVHRNPGMVAEGAYHFERYNQKKEPALARPVPAYHGDGIVTYTSKSTDMEPLDFHLADLCRRDGEIVRAKMFDDSEIVEGVLEHGPITEWVREFIRRAANGGGKYRPEDIEVMLPSHTFSRATEAMHDSGLGTRTLFSDGGQLHVTSRDTLDWMNQDLDYEGGGDSGNIRMSSFRPNIVLEGLPPNAEDLIDRIRIQGVRDDIELVMGGLCVRCQVITVDQKTGMSNPKQPTAWLAKNRPRRPDKPNHVTFGVNAAFPNDEIGKVISLGDEVEVISEKIS